MAKCTLCGAQTILHVNGVPFCVDCDKRFNGESSAAGPREGRSEKGSKPAAKEHSQEYGTERQGVSSR